jgi:hypothetical protein
VQILGNASAWPSICFFYARNRLSFGSVQTKNAMKKTTKVTKALTPAKKPAKAVVKTTPVPAAKVAPTTVVTTISASFDVGFGNALYVRGEGAGLSWDKGLLIGPPDRLQIPHQR